MFNEPANGHGPALNGAEPRAVNGNHIGNGEVVDEDMSNDPVVPLAIVGYSLRFPGEATDPETFWEMLRDARNVSQEYPRDRVNIDAFYHPDNTRPDSFPLRGGHFVEGDVGQFDAPFFSMTPQEAAGTDPQQRLILEAAYHALENAGIPKEQCFNSNTSVFTGSFTADYETILANDLEQESKYAATGIANCMLANRISWFFNFSGPSMQLDTACSSSLTALHLGCQTLRNKEASMCLVGGANLILGPEFHIMLSNMSFLSKDSRCWSFDHRANGYARGEGFGVVVIKRLEDAIASGDTIRAVIRNTGLNQDGRTPGITQPSGEAQKTLINRVYKEAGLSKKYTRYFEAHGTGTPTGDPIEAHAIGECFVDSRSPSAPLYIGALKSNIGHLEGASGVAALIKTVIALERGIIPPNCGLEKINEKIRADELNISFPVNCVPWPDPGLRRASVNSFGIGGANACAVLDDARGYLEKHGLEGKHRTEESSVFLRPFASVVNGHYEDFDDGPDDHLDNPRRPTRLITISAADESGIERVSKLYETHITKQERTSKHEYFQDLVYTLTARRSNLNWRSYAIASQLDDLRSFNSLLAKPVRFSEERKICFVFTGQGAQYARMGLGLFQYPVFQESIQGSEEFFKELGASWSLKEKILQDAKYSVINEPDYSQPVSTALQIGLIELLASFGVRPHAVVGHSSGEIAAAYASGAISRSAALRAAYHRGRLTAELARNTTHKGAMCAVGLGEQDVQLYIDRLKNEVKKLDVAVGCINSPSNVTLTGEMSQITTIESWLKEAGVFARKLVVPVAYHSEHMREISPAYVEAIGTLEPGCNPSVIMASSLKGKIVDADQLLKPEYWNANLTSPVRFSEAISLLCDDGALGVTDFLEVGPHTALRGPIREILKALNAADRITYRSTLIRKKPAAETILTTIGQLWCLGYPADLRAVNKLHSHERTVLADLPQYPFNHSTSHWIEGRLSKGYRFRQKARHELLGTQSSDWNPLQPRWRNAIRSADLPWANDHQIQGNAVYPASGLLCMAIEGVKQVAGHNYPIRSFEIKDVIFRRAIPIPSAPTEHAETQLCIRPLKKNRDDEYPWSEFFIYLLQDDTWHECCHGLIQVQYEQPNDWNLKAQMRERTHHYQKILCNGIRSCRQSMPSKKFYECFNESGIYYGSTFQSLHNLHHNNDHQSVATVQLRQWVPEGGKFADHHVIHPTTLDALFHSYYCALSKGGKEPIPTMVPSRVPKLWVSAHGLSEPGKRPLCAVATSHYQGYREARSSIVAMSAPEDGELRAVIEFEKSMLDRNQLYSADSEENLRPLCTNYIQRPDPEMMSEEQIIGYCQMEKPQHYLPPNSMKELNLAIWYFLYETIQSLASITVSKLEAHMQEYIEWMKMQVERNQNVYDPLQCITMAKMRTDVQFRETLLKRVEYSSKEGAYVVKLGRSLDRVLRADVEASRLLESSFDDVDYLQTLFANPALFHPFSVYLDLIADKNPSMKILEVNASAGRLTEPILDTLSRSGDDARALRLMRYEYTDASATDFDKQQSRFQKYLGRVHFSVFNPATDSAEQGFEEDSYDLIVATDILGDAERSKTSLSSIRKLLKPGGKLVSYELSDTKSMRTGFALGLLPRWHSILKNITSAEPESESTDQKLERILLKNGFTGIDLVFDDHPDDSSRMGSIIVSSKKHIPDSCSQHKFIVLVRSSNATQIGLAQNIRTHMHNSRTFDVEVLSLEDAAQRSDLEQSFVVSLLEVEEPFLGGISEQDFNSVKMLLTSTSNVLWVTRDKGSQRITPCFTLATGLGRSLQTEDSRMKFTNLALGGKAPRSSTETASTIMKLMEAMATSEMTELEGEYEEIDGMLHFNRLVEAKSLNESLAAQAAPHKRSMKRIGESPPLQARFEFPGVLNSMQFFEDTAQQDVRLADDEVVISVRAIGLNYRDVLIATGQINDNDLGTECSGIIMEAGSQSGFTVGQRVVACVPSTFRTHVRCKALHVTSIPDSFTLTDAAALAEAAVKAIYAVNDIARLTVDERILIHRGAATTGQVAIQVAQHIGAEIFTTVETVEGRNMLKAQYGIPDDHIFSTKSTIFKDTILLMTDGHGVDVVLNSLYGSALTASWETLACFGRFVELGKRDIQAHSNLPMKQFDKNVSFSSVDMAAIIRKRPKLLSGMYKQLRQLSRAGSLKPAHPVKSFKASECEKAFRYLQAGKAVGKVVIEFDKDCLVPVVLNTKPSYYMDPNATYLVAGGLGGLGQHITRWFVKRGARNLVLLSRSGAKSDTAKALVRELEDSGVHVEAPACDITNIGSLHEALQSCMRRLPPIRGAIQATMVSRDTVFPKMTHEDFTASVAPKASGSWNLHSALPKRLDFFIMLSSVTAAYGSPGAANYSAGNTYLNGLSRYRVASGEKATAIGLGFMSDAGVLLESPALLENFRRQGALMELSTKDLENLLEYYCNPQLPLLARTECTPVVGLQPPAVMQRNGLEPPLWMGRPLFRHVHHIARNETDETEDGDAGGQLSYGKALGGAASEEDKAKLITEWIIERCAKVLGISPADIDSRQPLHAYGIDSLLAVELRNWLGSDLAAEVAIFDIMGATSISALSKLTAERTKLGK